MEEGCGQMGRLGGVNVIVFKKPLRNGAGRPGLSVCLSATLSMGLNNSVASDSSPGGQDQTGNAGEVLGQRLTAGTQSLSC